MSARVETTPAPTVRRSLPGQLLAVAASKWVLRVLSLVTVLALWQLIGEHYPYSLSDPATIVRDVRASWGSEIVPAFGETLGSFALGYAICVVAGIPLGLLMARSRLAELSMSPYVFALYATPRLALIPVMILWLGVTFELRLAVVVVSGVFPILVNTYLGAKEVSRDHLDVGVAFAAKPLRALRTIVVPGSLHYIFAGMRIGLGRALVGMIVAEITTSVFGVGNLIQESAQTLEIGRMWGAIILLGFFALTCSSLIKFAERWTTMPWTRTRRLPWPSRP